MKIKVFTIQNDELDILEDWIKYHASIFGKENIHIINHKCTKASVDIIQQQGVGHTPFEGAFSDKHNQLTRLMLSKKHEADILIPMDIDEFICLYDDEKICTDKDRILSEFKSLPHNYRYKFWELYGVDDKGEYQDPLIDMIKYHKNGKHNLMKTFYESSTFLRTDQGNHHGWATTDQLYFTNLALLHFHTRGFKHFKNKMIKGKRAYGSSKTGGTHWKKFGAMIEQSDQEAKKAYKKCTSAYDIVHIVDNTFSNTIKSLRK